MKIAHVADAHLDSAFALLPAETARGRRQSIRAALAAAIEAAADAGAEVLLVAGDLYEHDRVSPDTGAFLVSLFREAAPLRIFVAPGNHDWYGPSSLYARLDWPENVHLFTEDVLAPVELEDGLTLWGAAHRAPANTDGFLDRLEFDRGGINIGLFHGSERGALVFQEEGKAPHAPFTTDQIAESGLAHVFSGHFHTPVDADWFTYPGNPDPLAFGEGGSVERGLVLATISGDGSVTRERLSVAQTQVMDEEIDLSGCASATEILARVSERLAGRTGCARVTVTGELPPEVELSLADVERCAPGVTIVARARNVTTAYDLEAIRQEGTVRAQFVEDVLAANLPDDLAQKIVVTGLRALEGRNDLEVV